METTIDYKERKSLSSIKGFLIVLTLLILISSAILIYLYFPEIKKKSDETFNNLKSLINDGNSNKFSNDLLNFNIKDYNSTSELSTFNHEFTLQSLNKNQQMKLVDDCILGYENYATFNSIWYSDKPGSSFNNFISNIIKNREPICWAYWETTLINGIYYLNTLFYALNDHLNSEITSLQSFDINDIYNRVISFSIQYRYDLGVDTGSIGVSYASYRIYISYEEEFIRICQVCISGPYSALIRSIRQEWIIHYEFDDSSEKCAIIPLYYYFEIDFRANGKGIKMFSNIKIRFLNEIS